jgi:hypothetical protein
LDARLQGWQLLLRPRGGVSAIIRRATGVAYNAEPEATVTFADGSTAYLCILQSVWRLQREGHTIRVVSDDEVQVDPPLANEDWTTVLGQNAAAVHAILSLDRTIH